MQLAEKGTLFLDEDANLPVTTQGKLLRMLQERQILPLGGKQPIAVDLRIIAASNVHLDLQAQAGRFRQDLLHRLNEFTIRMPPLRERPEDIEPLAQRFIDEANIELKKEVRGLSPEAVSVLMRHSWPGNVRELRNVIRRATLLSQDRIGIEHLSGLGSLSEASPTHSSAEGPLSEGLSLKEVVQRATAQVEKDTIERVLRLTKGNKSQAARLLQNDYKTLHYKIKAHDIHTKDFLL